MRRPARRRTAAHARQRNVGLYIDDTEAYIEDAAERMRQVWELFKTMKLKDVINDETTFRELRDRLAEARILSCMTWPSTGRLVAPRVTS